MDKLILSAGYMCDMTFFDADPDGNAFIHHIKDDWIFDKANYWSWLQPLANAGISMHRISLYCVGGSRKRSECFFPWQYVKEKDAFDLRLKNQIFFDILRQQVIEANKMKLQVMVCVMNECEERKPDRMEQSPYFHNVNGFEGLYAAKALPFIGTLARWICEALQGLDYSVELINEGHKRRSGSADAVNKMIPVLLEHGVEPWRISLGADVIDQSLAGFKPVGDWKTRWPNELQPPDRENYDIFIDRNHLVKYYDKEFPKATHQVFGSICHNFADRADPDYLAMFPYGRRTGYTIEAWFDRNLGSNRVCFSTDGTDHADAPSGRPSPTRMKAAMLWVMRHNPRYKLSPLIDGRPKLWFDFLPGGESVEKIVAVADAMAEAHYDFFGAWPENRGKVPPYIKPEPEPQPDPVPEPGPEPVKPPINWRGEWNNRLAWVKNNWGWVAGAILVLWLFFKVAY